MIALAVPNTRSRAYPALPESVTDARVWAADAAARAGAPDDVVDAVRLAVSEAATNVVLHAYPECSGDMQVNVAVAEGELWILVADRGRGHQSAPESPGLGWGLALIANVCHDFLITERSGGGTELRMGFALIGSKGAPAMSGTSQLQSAA